MMAMENMQPLAYAISSIAFAIGTASFFVRFYCRAVFKNAFGWDDVLSILLLVCTLHPIPRDSQRRRALSNVLPPRYIAVRSLTNIVSSASEYDAASDSLHLPPLWMRPVSINFLCRPKSELTSRSRSHAATLSTYQLEQITLVRPTIPEPYGLS